MGNKPYAQTLKKAESASLFRCSTEVLAGHQHPPALRQGNAMGAGGWRGEALLLPARWLRYSTPRDVCADGDTPLALIVSGGGAGTSLGTPVHTFCMPSELCFSGLCCSTAAGQPRVGKAPCAMGTEHRSGPGCCPRGGTACVTMGTGGAPWFCKASDCWLGSCGQRAEHLRLPLGMMDLQYLLSKLSLREHLASLDRELLQDILRYLHRIGLIVWYEEIKHLESTVFLQPTFLITMFRVSTGTKTTISAQPEFGGAPLAAASCLPFFLRSSS